MSVKKWFLIWIVSVIMAVLLIGIFNFITDPFQQYGKTKTNRIYFDNEKERYLNPGLAKTYKYDSILIGSSMTENFLISDLQKMMANPIKFCLSGASAQEIQITLNTALSANKNVKTVFLGLDFFAISGDKYRLRFGPNSLPMYLYDNNKINDYKYLLIADTMKESIKSYLRYYFTRNDMLLNYENMYQWQHLAEDDFGEESVLDDWKTRKTKNDKFFTKADWDFDKLKDSYDFNIASIIKKYPNINFIIYFPPYSVLTYIDWKNKNIFENIINTKKYIASSLINYPNLELYDFQNDSQITTNLDLYKDIFHHNQEINSYITEMISEKNSHYRVDANSYNNVIRNFDAYVSRSKKIY